jgi:hypothetical protein
MLSSSDNRKAPQHIISRGLWGLTVWWTAQGAQPQPADRDDTDRAGSYDGNRVAVSVPRPPPTIINEFKAPRMPVHIL